MTESAVKPPGVWKFWGTLLWGIFIFAAIGIGQIGVVAYFVLMQQPSMVSILGLLAIAGLPGVLLALWITIRFSPLAGLWLLAAMGIWQFCIALAFALTQEKSLSVEAVAGMLGNGRIIALSVIAGLPGVLLVLWTATRFARIPFADYLGLQRFSWKYLLIGVVGLAVLSQGWDFVAKGVGHEVTPGFMGEVLKTARAQNSLWLLVLSFCVAAPLTEELMTRGFLYRGWSESFLRPLGAIVVSSLVWTCMHLQYDAFFLAQVLSIGLLFGWLRYAGGSTSVTIVLHGLNNLAATLQTMYLLNNT